MAWEQVVESAASAVTACGIFLAACQLWQTGRQNRARFEDEIAREYRGLLKTIPIRALLRERLTEAKFAEARVALYHYVDLSNEEVFLRQQGKVSGKTWAYWSEGIRSNLSLPAFKREWKEIRRADSRRFKELRLLEGSRFKVDPKVRRIFGLFASWRGLR